MLEESKYIACCRMLAILALCMVSVTEAFAAGEGPAPRPSGAPPRIGLALSGGGARGIAHVGVLKALEEMRIPVHCVTGTSMGAIVGGTFAAGTPPARLEELVLTADWATIFRDQPPRDEISIRRKGDDFKTLFAPEFGFKDGGLALPKGVVAGVSIEAFFRVLAEPANGIGDFRKLPIPFEAMATDIETGASVVLAKGSLAQAMRASMSVPGAISPVEIDGRLLVDGGIANNLPIDQARKLCGDVVIAVNISTPPLARENLTSALTVVAQLINFLGKQTVDDQLKRMGPGDVLIEPDLGTISAGSFVRSAEAIRIGEEATRKLAAALSRYSLPAEQYAALRASQVAGRSTLGAVDEIRFEGLERTNPAVLSGLVKSVPGEPLTEEKVGADLRRIYGRGDFESVSYHIDGIGSGPRAMVITPREKLWGPDYLRFGLGLQSDFQGDNSFNVLVQYRKTWLNRLGGEWLTEAQVGQNTHLYSEWYQPLTDSGEWFAAAYGRVGQTTQGVFIGNDKVAEYLVGAAQGGFDLGSVFGTYGALRAGPVWTRVNARVETGDPVLPTLRELTAGGRVWLRLDQLDNPWFPQAGYLLNASYYGATTALGSALDYQRLEAAGSYAMSWGPHTVTLSASGGTDFGTNMPAYESFTLGGPLRLSGFRLNQFTGREYAFGRAMYYKNIYPLPEILGSGIYAGASAEVGMMRNRVGSLPSPPGTLFSGSLFIGASTFAGPAYLGAGFGNGGAFSIYMLLGAP
ncbi:MAG TPA: patatin-like phospholipase family protein [Casimicrobiaceae bacterium]|nr:patatin-like phospholipase family protein [Casimicrobiaceae bacterium]